MTTVKATRIFMSRSNHEPPGGWAREEQQIEVELRDDWLHFLGGPTGYESLPARGNDGYNIVNDITQDRERAKSWYEHDYYACAGTPGRWDALVIDGEDLVNLLAALGLIEPHVADDFKEACRG